MENMIKKSNNETNPLEAFDKYKEINRYNLAYCFDTYIDTMMKIEMLESKDSMSGNLVEILSHF
jgi:hypothetical protein